MSTSDPVVQPLLSITLFGGLTVRVGEQPVIGLRPQQSASLLAFLSLHSQRAHTREEILALFWPDSDPEKARQNLRQCLHTLRTVLESQPIVPGTALLSTRSTVQLNPKSVCIDVVEFERTIASASRTGDRVERIAAFQHAVQLYRGELLPGFYHDAFLHQQRRLADIHLQALGSLVTELMEAGDPARALPYARQAVSLDPLSEQAHIDLMRVYGALGQSAAILRQYGELEAVLEKELGETPSDKTRALADALVEASRRPSSVELKGATHREAAHVQQALPVRPTEPVLTDTAMDDSNVDSTGSGSRFVPRKGWPVLITAATVLLFFLIVRQNRRAAPSDRPNPGAASAAAKEAASLPEPRNISSQPSVAPMPSVWPKSLDLAPDELRASDSLRFPSPYHPGTPLRVPIASQSAGAQALMLPIKTPEPLSQEANWAVRYSRQAGESEKTGSEPTAITVDSAGNVYVTGRVQMESEGVDYLTMKYNAYGERLWRKYYNGPGNDYDRANSIAVDAAGCVYVTGESVGGSPGSGPDRHNRCDIATIKYDPDGELSTTWPDVGFGPGVRRYAGPAYGLDSGSKILIDSKGNALVYGQSWGGDPKDGGTGADLILIEYSSNGEVLKSIRHPGGTVGPGAAPDMVIDTKGNVYVIGRVLGQNNCPALITVKYDADLNMIWEDRYGGKEAMGAVPTCLVLTGFQQVYVVGHESFYVSNGLGPGEAYAILKYDPGGRKMWSEPATYRWPGYSYSHLPIAATLDGGNGLYVTGSILRESASPGCGTLQIGTDGTIGWADPYRSTGRHGHFATAMAVNSLGEVFAAGWGTFLDPTSPSKETTEFTVLQFGRAHRYSAEDPPPHVWRLGTYGRIGPRVLMTIDHKDNVIVCGQALFGPRYEITLFKLHP